MVGVMILLLFVVVHILKSNFGSVSVSPSAGAVGDHSVNALSSCQNLPPFFPPATHQLWLMLFTSVIDSGFVVFEASLVLAVYNRSVLRSFCTRTYYYLSH